ncbi:MAG: SusC/RagA family TonB-linked outer membrane protein [Bacteroidales bacterium]|nr:SusC/RagA family TonB-linked outer membrane protein [Bacteroidales bacterium]
MRFLRRSASVLLIFSLTVSLAIAQQRTINGTVTSESEGPLVGVNVVVQGTTIGGTTDISGNYSITVPGPEAVLVFSYIGYTPLNVTVGSQSRIDVVLEPTMSALGEIVVTGYSTQKKKEITSSISRVSSEEFNKGSISSPEQLIIGKVAGLSISRPGGNPNEGYNIRLRGLSTVGANTQPLVVIDGVIGGSLDNVDPNDIESMNVLKDGSAASIYGTRGSSGVIIVTTKRGKRGSAMVEYNVYGTADLVAKTVPVMNPAEWRKLSQETGLGTDFGFNTDWFDEITRTAFNQVHNISLSGGSDKSTYRASVNYHNEQGVQITTGYEQINGRLNFSQKALNDKLTLDLNVGATKRESKYGFSDAFRYATVYNPTAPVKSDADQYKQYDGYFQQVLFDYYNPVQILELNKNDGQDKLVNVALKGTYELFKGLSVDAFYSVQTSDGLRGMYYDKNSYFVGMNRNGLASRSENTSVNQLFESTLRWNGDVASGVNLNAVGGYSYQDFYYEGFYAEGGDFLTDAFTYNNLAAALDFKNGKGTITSYKNSNKLIAFFSQVNLNIKDIWFLTASARYEGSSRFGENNKWGLFPAIGGGVDLAHFLGVSGIDVLKLRGSYGVTGNMPGSSYLSLLRLGPSGNFYYNGEFVPGYAPVSNANTDLKWEKKGEIDVGLDFAFFNSKLSGSVDFYTRTTTDLLFQYEVPVPPNLYNQAWMNLGEIKSSGIEMSLTWNAVTKPDFTYTISFTPSYNIENTLVSLSGSYNGADLNYGKRDLGEMGSPGQTAVPLVRVEEGKPIGQLWALVYKEIDEDGNLIFEDMDESGGIDPLDRRVVGNGLPDFLFGLGNSFTFRNWDMNIFLRGVLGHDLLNSYRGFYEVPNMIGSYNLPKTANDMRNPQSDVLLNNSSGVLSSFHVEDASFVTLDNLSLGYNFDMTGSAAFSKIRVYLSGNNLFYLTGYKGVDPNPRYEDGGNPLIPGIDRRNTWFRTRSVSVGANIVF